ncbi:MAG: phosphatidate cytidylyltransferase [Bacteroidales bacterium]|nr:phosphatidate cytidylyltransferase [Bacteroidales bacterium]
MKELAIRTISGVVFCVLTLASLIIVPHNPYPFLILFSFYLVRTDYEYLRLTMGKGKVVLKIITLIASLCLFWGLALMFYLDRETISSLVLFLIIFVVLIAIPVADLLDGEKPYMSFSLSSLFYIVLPFSLLIIISLQSSKIDLFLSGSNAYNPFFSGLFDGWVIASLLIVMWMGDVGAYCIGSAFGQGEKGHKLMPSVSPKKSWEGVYGAVAFSIAAALILRTFGLLMPYFPYWVSVVFALVVCAFSILGDLVESKLKRRFQIKDAGRIMPGHGGLLDRFDSGLLAFPAAFLFYTIALWVI